MYIFLYNPVSVKSFVYEFKKAKCIANLVTVIAMIIPAGIWSSTVNDYSTMGADVETAGTVAFAFTWISVIFSGIGLTFAFTEKD